MMCEEYSKIVAEPVTQHVMNSKLEKLNSGLICPTTGMSVHDRTNGIRKLATFNDTSKTWPLPPGPLRESGM